MNIKDGGIEEMNPEPLLKKLSLKNTLLLFGFLGDVCKGKDIEFI